ncbi:DUF2651 family protein [Bacillus sp. FSL W7-1360]
MRRVGGVLLLVSFIMLMSVMVHYPFAGGEMTMVLLLFPMLIVIISIVVTLLLNYWYVMPVVTCMMFTFYMFTVFNTTFLIWVVSYTLLSLVASVLPWMFVRARKSK